MNHASLRTTLAIAGTLLALAIAAPAEAAKIHDQHRRRRHLQRHLADHGERHQPHDNLRAGHVAAAAGAPTCTITPSQTVSSGTPSRWRWRTARRARVDLFVESGLASGTQVSTGSNVCDSAAVGDHDVFRHGDRQRRVDDLPDDGHRERHAPRRRRRRDRQLQRLQRRQPGRSQLRRQPGSRPTGSPGRRSWSAGSSSRIRFPPAGPADVAIDCRVRIPRPAVFEEDVRHPSPRATSARPGRRTARATA